MAICVEGHAEEPSARAEPAVIVTGTRRSSPIPSVGGPLNDQVELAPAQITVIPLSVLQQPEMQRASSALNRDASVGENYAAIGYYENFSIRGFTLDQGSAYRINGFIVPGELHVALDDKERIEILKGVGTLAAGAASPGGLVNFVTKRPADVAAARLDLTPRGGRHAGVDFGGAPEVFGYRINAAHEDIRPYVEKANGHRDFLSLALDGSASGWTVAGDIEYQRRSQFAVPGFQLLGGSALPPILPATNINQQPWSRPVENQGWFAGVRAEHYMTQDWKLRLGVGLGRARIDDNLAFPFGCNDAPFQYFCADGSYVLYDYHSKELRQTTHTDATVFGTIQGGEVNQRVAFGIERIARTVSQRDYYSNTLVDAAGRGLMGNINDPSAPLPAPPSTPTDRATANVGQRGIYVADEIAWHAWRVQGALRLVQLWQRQYGDVAQTHVLPQYALIRNLDPHSRVYWGQAKGLEFGSEAPLTAENAGELLPPRQTKQNEVGWKGEWRDLAISTAAFRMQRPYEFTDVNGNSFAGMGKFHQAGTQTHTGWELAGQGRPTARLQILASAAWIHARAKDTGEPAFEGVQIQNIPRIRSTLFARYAFARAPGLELSAAWSHSGKRNARRDGSVSVPSYDRFDTGLSWTTVWSRYRARVMLNATNLTDRRYWRDASEAYSADLLFPGAPREIVFGVLVEGT